MILLVITHSIAPMNLQASQNLLVKFTLRIQYCAQQMSCLFFYKININVVHTAILHRHSGFIT